MKRLRLKLPIAVLLAAICLSQSTRAADPHASTVEGQQLLTLVMEVKTQEAAIAENQTKIDAKLAAVTEAVRVARIYSGRGGR